jgi:serine phosphatase RsbU (regulator of sigma subunit)/CHASE3 domain sensor protein
LGIRRDLPLSRRFRAPLVLTLAFLLVVVALLVVGGLFVRSIVAASFLDSERFRVARVHVADLLKEQLDEETGVRGYSATRVRLLLAPYFEGRVKVPVLIRRIRLDLEELDVRQALPALHDASLLNWKWVHEVAFPLVLKRGPHRALEIRGKYLMDRFREDVAGIDVALARRTTLTDAGAQSAVVWVGGFALGAVIAVVLAATIFTTQQYRMGVRLERERIASEEERRIGEILQDALAERILPALPMVRFSATYVPATEQTKIGGDWYDALQLSENRVLIAIGDVAGHGIEAVMAMNRARHMLIGCALLDPTPDRVLARVNAELVRIKSPMTTALSGIVDAKTLEFAYATAGHPPPVLVEPGGRARLLEFGALPLGVVGNAEYRTHRVAMVPGAMIVLYTDGAIEHSHDLAQGESTLLEAVEAAARRPPAEAAKVIRNEIFGRRKAVDDVAILTVHLGDPNALRRIA